MNWLALGLVTAMFTACASVRTPAASLRLEGGNALTLAGIVGCGDAPPRLVPARPLAILVHGVHASGDGLARLADAFAADGQQALCFRYDGRASLLRSAHLLRSAIVALSRVAQPPTITLFGHSQGGLVARAALARGAEQLPAARYSLVTVATPFAGIRVARACGSIPYHLVSFGVSYAVCRAISGDSWNQIHPGAVMVRAPSELDPSVHEHLLVVTDERESCRRFSADGLHCLQDDYVFSTAEQHNVQIERDRRVTTAAIEAGHVAVLGAQGPPRKLVEALQRQGLLGRELGARATRFEVRSASASW
jgi:pimeloyl-ACP methyl ester carboxylesterase